MKTLNNTMVKLATKLLKVFGTYVKEFEKEYYDAQGFIYIKYENGEIIAFAESKEKLIEEVPSIK